MVRMDAMHVFLFSKMKEAVTEFLSEGYELPNPFWIVTPTGLAFDLRNIPDITIPELTVPTLKIYIPGIGYSVSLSLPDVDLDFIMGSGSFLSKILNYKFGNSDKWYYGGPFRDDVWPPQKGDTFSPPEYYKIGDFLLDSTIIATFISIIIVVAYLGFNQLATKMIQKIVLTGVTGESIEKKIYDKVQDIDEDVVEVKSEIVASGTHLPLWQNVLNIVNTLAGLVNNVYLIITRVGKIYNSDEESGKLKDVEVLMDNLTSIIAVWNTYVDEYTLWLQNPSITSRPVRPEF